MSTLVVVPPARFEHTFFLEAAGASEDDPSHQFDVAVTLTKLRTILVGTTPSVDWTLRHGPDRSAAGTEVVTGGSTATSTTTGESITSFSSASIPAGDHLWLETTAQSGTVLSFRVTIIGTED